MKKQILKMINTILIISFIVLSSLLVAIPRANAAEATQSAAYKGMPGYKTIAKISPKLAQKMGWAHNKSFINGVMKFKGAILDAGGDLTGAYAKEVALTQGYKYLTWIGGIF